MVWNLVDNRLMMPAQTVEVELSEENTKESTPPPRKGQNRRQRRSCVSLDSLRNRKFVASSKWRVLPSRTPFNIDLREILNAKCIRGSDLRNKLNNQMIVALGKDIILVGSAACAMEPVLRYQMSFFQDIEGIDPPKKFKRPRFTLYDGKSDPRSHISHIRQMMVLWNHLDALMCQVFPLNLGDLGLK